MLLGVQICIATMEINEEFPQKGKNLSTSISIYMAQEHMPEWQLIFLQSHLVIHVHSFSIYNRQNWETV